jgi:hypothetical protein
LALNSGEWFFRFFIQDHFFPHAIHLNNWSEIPRPPLSYDRGRDVPDNRCAKTARQQARSSKLDNERDVRQPKSQTLRDPSREMFAIDTGNPDIPTYPNDGFDDLKRKN